MGNKVNEFILKRRVNYLNNGLSLEEIARKEKTSYSNISTYFNDKGIKWNKIGKITLQRRVNYLNSGLSLKEIAEKEGISQSSVINYFRYKKIKLEKTYGKDFEKEKRRLEYKKQGLSISEIAKLENTSRQTIQIYFKTNKLGKLNRKINNNIPKDIVKEIHEKYLSGISLVQLSKEYGYSKQIIYYYFKRNNLPIKHYKVSPERKALMLTAYNNGMPLKSMSIMFGYKRTESLMRCLNNIGYTPNRKTKIIFTKDKTKEIFNRCKEIGIFKGAKEYETTYITLIKYFKLYGFKHNRKGGKSSVISSMNRESIRKIHKEFKSGIHLFLLAKKYFANINTLKKHLINMD